MVQCTDCGFCEPSQYLGNLTGTCAEDPKHPMHISNTAADIECKKFIEKRRGWELRDVHEWRDRYVNMKMTKRLAMISLCVSLVLGGVSVSYTYLSHQAQQASIRGDLTILNSHATWAVTNSSCSFNVTGEIRNEGVRAIDIISIMIIVDYPMKDSRVLALQYPNKQISLSWNNYTLLEKEIREFSLVTGIIFDNVPYQLDQYPTQGSIVITYNDGLGNQEQTRFYPFVRSG